MVLWAERQHTQDIVDESQDGEGPSAAATGDVIVGQSFVQLNAKASHGKWKCPSCFIYVENAKAKCPSCDAWNPAKQAEQPGGTPSHTGGLTVGVSNTTSGFTFGVPNTGTGAPATFSFGVSPAASGFGSTGASSEPPTSGFTFGSATTFRFGV